jgi:N-acetylglucosaminyl-diphospho-decaprenol L-rhamnosyltransferase
LLLAKAERNIYEDSMPDVAPSEAYSTGELVNENRSIAVIIVSYCTPRDVVDCLASLDNSPLWPDFEVYICENGGSAAWDELSAAISGPEGVCDPATLMLMPVTPRFSRIAGFRLRRSGRNVLVGEATGNFGYAGGINAWLVPLLEEPHWTACWILNPDTIVMPTTLAALVAHASERQLGMVGSRIMRAGTEQAVHMRGLCWRPVRASPVSVGRGAPPEVSPDVATTEAELDAASGASVYIARTCAEWLLPFDERYFLYFEDLDWGIRTQRAGFRIGYANDSVVIHRCGTSIGSSVRGSLGSALATYLEFRNRLLFVRTHYHRWLLWTFLMSHFYALRLLPKGGFGLACKGIWAGLRGEVGRPDGLVEQHRKIMRTVV